MAPNREPKPRNWNSSGGEPDDDRLVRACQARQAGAGTALIARHWEWVLDYAHRLKVSAADAEDLTQETFLRALRALPSYRPDGKFRAWLLRIATNLHRDERKASRSRDITMPPGFDAEAKLASPEENAAQQELLARIVRASQDLSTQERIVLTLRTCEGWDYTQIAAALGVPESTARGHMHEARRKLREKLGE